MKGSKKIERRTSSPYMDDVLPDRNGNLLNPRSTQALVTGNFVDTVVRCRGSAY